VGKLTELRSLLSATKREMGIKGATSKEIVAAFSIKYPKQIADVNARLVEIALTKLVNEGRNRPPRGIVAGQLDLFGEYNIPGSIVLRVTGKDGIKHVHKDTGKTTIGEMKRYLDDHSKPRSPTTKERRELRRLVLHLEPFKKSDNSTIEDCWRAAQKDKKAG
jgi:hypothetical protein